jgi:hypothetical protein
LLNDCCHSGSIWNIPKDQTSALAFPGNIISFSASEERETSKQESRENGMHGLFTYYFWKHYKENSGIAFRELQPLVDESLVQFNQHAVVTPTRSLLASESFLPAA